MIQSTQLKVLPDDILHINYTRMKGSLLRIGHSRLIRPQSNYHAHTSLELNNPSSSPSRELLINNQIVVQQGQFDAKFFKTMSLMTQRELPNGRIVQRANTPLAAKNYSRAHQSSDNHSPSQPLQNNFYKTGRYVAEQLEHNKEFRMSLACFKQNSKERKDSKKTIMTDEEMMKLKLEGTQCKLALGSARSKKDQGKNGSKQSCQFIQDWYITQQGAKLNFDNSFKKHESFEKVILKIQQQPENKEKSPHRQRKSESCKKIKTKTSIGPRLHQHQRKHSARLREQAHLNVINIQERPDLQQQKLSQPYHELYSRYLKSHNENHCYQHYSAFKKHQQLKVSHEHHQSKASHEHQEDNSGYYSRFQNIMDEIRRIPEGLLDEKKKQSIRSQKKTDRKIIQSHQQKKLQERKNLMKNYTFKKQNSQSKAEVVAVAPSDDFHVEGWNESQEFQRKEPIMIV